MSKGVNGSVIVLVMFSAMFNDARANWPIWHTHQLECITNNNSANAAAGERQLSFNITTSDEWHNSNSISFKFYNDGTTPMVVSRIVFDFPDGMHWIGGGMGDFQNGVLVFDFVTSPQIALPGGDNTVPSFHNDFELYGSCGLHPNQMFNAGFYFNVNTATYDIENAIRTGAFRVGFYVDSFANGGNESFVSVPEPATVLLIGLGGMIIAKNRKRKA